MDSASVRERMLANAAEITRLRARIDETLGARNTSARGREEWKNACAEFHSRFSELAFPGGYDHAPERILAGELEAMEAAVCFLECRPYFFRSGYMYKELLRKTKRAPLTPEQSQRFQVVLESRAEWQRRKSPANVA